MLAVHTMRARMSGFVSACIPHVSTLRPCAYTSSKHAFACCSEIGTWTLGLNMLPLCRLHCAILRQRIRLDLLLPFHLTQFSKLRLFFTQSCTLLRKAHIQFKSQVLHSAWANTWTVPLSETLCMPDVNKLLCTSTKCYCKFLNVSTIGCLSVCETAFKSAFAFHTASRAAAFPIAFKTRVTTAFKTASNRCLSLTKSHATCERQLDFTATH